MTISLQNANSYFTNRINSDEWNKSDDKNRQSALTTAETMLTGSFTLRDGYEDNPSYEHAVFEQAIHLLQMDRERAKLQREGVAQYSVGDNSFTMKNTLISLTAKAFLKPLIYRKAGNVI